MDETHIQKVNAEALLYLGLGWRVMPLVYGSKTPLLKSWPNLGSQDLMQIWPYETACNIGVILGREGQKKHNLVDFDLDCEEAQRLGPAIFPDTAQFGYSGKTTHLFFYCSSDVDPQKLHLMGVELELRSGALQTMVPPSVHPSGAELKWVGPNRAPKIYSREQINQNFNLLAALTLIAKRWPKISGSRNDFALAVSGVLGRSKLFHKQRKDIISLVASIAEDEEAANRPSVEKAIQKLAINEPVAGLRTLSKYLSSDDCASIGRWLEVETSYPGDQSNKIYEADALNYSMHIITAGQLAHLDLPSRSYIIEPWLPEAALVQLFAARGVGKTWFAMSLAVAVSQGGLFLRYGHVKKSKVLYVDGEMALKDLKQRLN